LPDSCLQPFLSFSPPYMLHVSFTLESPTSAPSRLSQKTSRRRVKN
jgi:hypothetical protein